MRKITRREFLKASAGAVAGGVLGVGAGVGIDEAKATADAWTPQIDKGAKLRVVRWNKFVQGDETLWMQNTKKFTEQYKVDVVVNSESFDDIRPKAAVAANVG